MKQDKRLLTEIANMNWTVNGLYTCIGVKRAKEILAKADKHKSVKGEILGFKKRPDLVFPPEYCEHRLDRPDREKIASIHCFRGSLSQWNDLFPIDREPYYKEADQILALFDEEEIRKQERERILANLPERKSILAEAAYTGGDVPKKWINDRGFYIEGYNKALDDIRQALKQSPEGG